MQKHSGKLTDGVVLSIIQNLRDVHSVVNSFGTINHSDAFGSYVKRYDGSLIFQYYILFDKTYKPTDKKAYFVLPIKYGENCPYDLNNEISTEFESEKFEPVAIYENNQLLFLSDNNDITILL